METLMLGGKPGYTVGGTVHVIINNQVGFTEPNPMSAWPAQYCTDVTRMVDAPVLRVNADEPEQHDIGDQRDPVHPGDARVVVGQEHDLHEEQ